MEQSRPRHSNIVIVMALTAFACSIAAIIVAILALGLARDVRDASPFMEGSPARIEAERQGNRLRSATQARAIAQAVLMYARAHDDEAPTSDNWRDELLSGQYISEDTFVSRGGADVDVVYHYVRPTPDEIRTMYSSGTTRVVIVYEDPALWSGEGGHVTYLDTSTEWIEGDEFQALVEEIRARD